MIGGMCPPYLSADLRDGAKAATVQATATRPNDTTAYDVGDVIGSSPAANLEFAGVARVKGGGARLTAVTLHKSTKTVTAADVDLYLFDAAPTAIADNAEWLPSDAEARTIVAFVRFVNGDAAQTGGSTNATGAIWQKSVPPVQVVCAAGSTTLYGVLVARAAHTPAAQEVWAVTLHLERD